MKTERKIGVWVELDSSPTVTLAVLIKSHTIAAVLRFLTRKRGHDIYSHDTYLIKLLQVKLGNTRERCKTLPGTWLLNYIYYQKGE